MTAGIQGRPTDCIPSVIEAVGDSIALGLSVRDACELCGLAHQTYYNWQNRGQTETKRRLDGASPIAREQPFVDFFDALTRAHLVGQQVCAQRVRDAATPHDEVTRTIKIEAKKDKDGKIEFDEDGEPRMITTIDQTVVREGVFDWKAALEVLRRRHGPSWGDAGRMELTGAGGGPIQVSTDELMVRAEEALARAAEKQAAAGNES